MSIKKTEAEEKASNLLYKANTKRLTAIIKPLRQSTYTCDFEWRSLDRAFATYALEYGMCDLCPDFQRGHVWTEQQQIHYIENALRGVVSAPAMVIQFNCPNWEDDSYVGDLPHGMQCVDGLQRITAVLRFMRGEILAFGSLSVEELKISRYSLTGGFRFRLEMFNFQSKKELISHYLDLNTGGTPHSAEEIARVRGML